MTVKCPIPVGQRLTVKTLLSQRQQLIKTDKCLIPVGQRQVVKTLLSQRQQLIMLVDKCHIREMFTVSHKASLCHMCPFGHDAAAYIETIKYVYEDIGQFLIS